MCHSVGDDEHAVCQTCWEKFTLESELVVLTKAKGKPLGISQVAGMALAALALGLVITCANQMLSIAQRMLKAINTQ